MQLAWPLTEKKQIPTYISFSPEATDLSEHFVNPFLGYTNCPIIGRYNRGEYKIGETLFQLQFKCQFDQNTQSYLCGNKPIMIPQLMHHNLRNISQVIVNNKAAGLKNSPEVLPERYPVRRQLSVYWIVSFGELGNDFLNYLNHMYILACTLFLEQKLQRMLHYLPIYAFLPQNSGLMKAEVERGLNFKNYRGQYMSFHLNKGAPAFSPNNMRLGVDGGKVVTNKQPPRNDKKQKNNEKPKYIEKEKAQSLRQKKDNRKKEEEEFVLNWSQIENANQSYKNEKPSNKIPQKQKQLGNKHQGFIHFYTSVLLEKDYRIYYHWHIEDQLKQEMIKEIWKHSTSLQEFVEKYPNFIGIDPMLLEVKELLFSKQ